MLYNVTTLLLYIGIISIALCIAGYMADNSKIFDKLFRTFYKGE
jgi:hypothetical protein